MADEGSAKGPGKNAENSGSKKGVAEFSSVESGKNSVFSQLRKLNPYDDITNKGSYVTKNINDYVGRFNPSDKAVFKTIDALKEKEKAQLAAGMTPNLQAELAEIIPYIASTTRTIDTVIFETTHKKGVGAVLESVTNPQAARNAVYADKAQVKPPPAPGYTPAVDKPIPKLGK